MLEPVYNGHVVTLDVRPQMLRGEHPKNEIVQFVREAQRGTIVELHMLWAAPPLVAALEAIGVNAIVNKLGPDHYRLMCVKI